MAALPQESKEGPAAALARCCWSLPLANFLTVISLKSIVVNGWWAVKWLIGCMGSNQQSSDGW